MDYDTNPLGGAISNLSYRGVDGIVNPAAHGRVAVLMHGEVEGADGHEGPLRIDAPVVENVVDRDCQEGVEGAHQSVCLW